MTKSSPWLFVAIVALLSACRDSPSIQITSPSNGQVVANGNRDITVSGTGSRIDSVQVKLNGAALPPSAVSATANTFTTSLTLGNNANTIEAIASHSDGSTSSSVVTVVYPFATFTIFQKASVVIGQADFEQYEGNRGNSIPGANTFGAPIGRALVSDGKLYLPDQGNNRVLIYNSVPAANGASADMVLGQRGFDTNGWGTTAAQCAAPRIAAAESDKLMVTDANNNRVLIYNHMPTQFGEAANLVVGWDNFDTPIIDGDCAANRFKYPRGIFVVNGKLLVADLGNNRVLIWSSIPTENGVSADLVLGQSGFTTCEQNAGGTNASTATLNNPTDVWSDGTRVVVADSGNNRVLIWKTFPTANGASADLVVDNFTEPYHQTQTSLNYPGFVSSNGNQLFVADSGHNRVLIWNTFPSENGAPADVVLGQSDFEHIRANDYTQDNSSDDHPTDKTLSSPIGVALWGNQLFVTDTSNSRYLIFDGE